MLLAVDIGNTNILCGGIVDGQIRHSFRMATHKDRSAAEYALQLNELIKLYFHNPKELDSAIISSVVPEVTHSIEKAIIETLYILPVIVKREIPAPFPVLLTIRPPWAATGSPMPPQCSMSTRCRPSFLTWAPPPPALS